MYSATRLTSAIADLRRASYPAPGFPSLTIVSAGLAMVGRRRRELLQRREARLARLVGGHGEVGGGRLRRGVDGGQAAIGGVGAEERAHGGGEVRLRRHRARRRQPRRQRLTQLGGGGEALVGVGR